MTSPLPGAPWLARQGQDLVLDGCSLDELGQRFGTPLYAYSRSAMKAALAGYQRALAGRPHLVCYAMKANSALAVLQTFAQAGCGFDNLRMRHGDVEAQIGFAPCPEGRSLVGGDSRGLGDAGGELCLGHPRSGEIDP